MVVHGEKYQKVEFDAYCEETGRERHFVITDFKEPFGDETPAIFKISDIPDTESSSELSNENNSDNLENSE